MEAILIIFLLVCLVRYCLIYIPPYTGVVIMNRFKGSMRSVGSGWHILFPWEVVDEVDGLMGVAIRSSSINFSLTVVADDETATKLELTTYIKPLESHLVNFRAFDDDTRTEGIKSKLSSIIFIQTRKMKDREAIMNSIDEIAKNAKLKFEESKTEDSKFSLEQYFGVNLEKLMIKDHGLPDKLVDAAVAEEVTVKENSRRQKEMDKLRELARQMVEDSRGKMPFQTAFEHVQMLFGKNVNKNIQIYGLDRGVLKTLEDISKNFSKAIKSAIGGE